MEEVRGSSASREFAVLSTCLRDWNNDFRMCKDERVSAMAAWSTYEKSKVGSDGGSQAVATARDSFLEAEDAFIKAAAKASS